MQDAREPMIQWLAAAVESSAGRAKMGRNIRQLPSDAFCLTLNTVLLKLCDPFVDPSANKAWSKLDIRCGSLHPHHSHPFHEGPLHVKESSSTFWPSVR